MQITLTPSSTSLHPQWNQYSTSHQSGVSTRCVCESPTRLEAAQLAVLAQHCNAPPAAPTRNAARAHCQPCVQCEKFGLSKLLAPLRNGAARWAVSGFCSTGARKRAATIATTPGQLASTLDPAFQRVNMHMLSGLGVGEQREGGDLLGEIGEGCRMSRRTVSAARLPG